MPLLKFNLASLFSLGLVSALTALPPTVEHETVPWLYLPLLVWCTACGLVEVLHLCRLAEHRAAWRVGPLGFMNLSGIGLASVSLLAEWAKDGEHGGVLMHVFTHTRDWLGSGMLAISVMLLWASHAQHGQSGPLAARQLGSCA